MINVMFQQCLTLDGIPLIVAQELYEGVAQMLDVHELAESGVGLVLLYGGCISHICGPVTLPPEEARAWCDRAVGILDRALWFLCFGNN
jgi:hypothetical protein